MKITIIIRNEDQSHEEVDNLANAIEQLLEDEGLKNVKQEIFSTEYHVTGDTIDSEEVAETDDEEEE